ncbi:GntR family transcriptional regulator [Micromonospora saelicesensis]|uniref:GntR family transcriptional regulator n=1 Tax=Micromonospora saelicesensis TaxID=285676 RepID=UPI000DD98730|nr:GntR family transcriptional regulator [Micromonospora saelicesensis]
MEVEMTSDLGAKAPKYQRIADELRRDIKNGTYGPGQRLPAEAALLERFRATFPSLSLETMRSAIRVLRAEGIVEARQGVGTFVSSNRRLQRRSRNRYGRARTDGKLLTSHLRHEIPFAGRGPIPEHVAETAGMEPGEEVVLRRRLLFDRESGKLQEIGASYLPLDFAGGTFLEEPTVVPKALFLCVEDLSGKKYAHARDHWQWRMPAPAEAEALQIAPGNGVVHLIHVARAQDDTILEVSESIWPADRIEIIDEYDVTQEPEDAEGLSDV